MMTIRAARIDEKQRIGAIDDDASQLYATMGIRFDHLDAAHPYVRDETARWLAALSNGRVWFSLEQDEPVGLAILGYVDNAPYLDQLSVRMAYMGRGHGRRLIDHARSWAKGELWLTTYSHLSWNRAFYERRGFRMVSESDWGLEMRAIIALQRASLPAPEARIVMRG